MAMVQAGEEDRQRPGPLERYRALIAEGALVFDAAQAEAAEALELLANRLLSYDPAPAHGFIRTRPRANMPKGLYLFGGVGRGKSMLMDMFFAAAPLAAKRRVHFHAFMLEIHALIGAWRKMSESERRAQSHYVKGAGDDPVPPAAKKVAQEAALLCFDEFQVEDIADAMILSRLFKELFERGVIIVATSNRAPDELYKDGLNRQLFLPFLALLKEKLDLIELRSGEDYRLRRIASEPVYHIAHGIEGARLLDAAWSKLADNAPGAPATIEVQGRAFAIPRAARGIARFSFDALCREPRGAADYLALAENFHVVMIDGIPRLSSAERNEAKRFLLLIDELYEHKVKLICTADVPPTQIYVEGDGAFAFKRASSRLIEMQSTDYLAAPHRAG